MPHIDNTPIKLNVTEKAQHRVYVGLGWDPNLKEAGLADKIGEAIGGRKTYHDLDLNCFFYDKSGAYIGVVGPAGGAYSDSNGFIYHNGDDAEGIGEGDDEQVSAELKDLEGTEIRQLLFVVNIKSGHSFGEIQDAAIHLSDGYTNRAFLQTQLGEQTGKDKNAFVFARLHYNGASWMMQDISAYLDAQATKNMPASLSAFINQPNEH